MTDTDSAMEAAAISDSLAYLKAVAFERLQPREARLRFGAVQARHPGIGMRLVWQEESYDGSLHYDVLMLSPTGSILSLSFAADGGLPWPLRGVRRWSDGDLVQVNGQVLTMRDAVELLDVVWNEAPIMERMINSCLIREELAQHPIEISDAELQQGMDGWRRAHRLYTSADTLHWMQQRGVTHERLEDLVSLVLGDRGSHGEMTMYRVCILVTCAVMACGSHVTTPQPHVTTPSPRTVVIDMFGTKQVTLDTLLFRYGNDLSKLCQPESGQSPTLLADLEALGDFVNIDFGRVSYFNAPGTCFLTVDFVDRADAARRMPFGPEPTGTYTDPAGLISDWRTYESKVFSLMGTGQMSSVRTACPAYHCFGDHSHPEVRQLAARFVELVPQHVEELATILRDDRSGSRRASAAFLLAYSHDGPGLVDRMVAASRDPDGLVRNNAMRVLADIAFHHPELEIPLEPVLTALEYPTTLDRNKAAAILTGLLERPDGARLRGPIARRAWSTLLAMLRLQQPNNHNFAYLILKSISGQSYGERDYAAWENWGSSQGYG